MSTLVVYQQVRVNFRGMFFLILNCLSADGYIAVAPSLSIFYDGWKFNYRVNRAWPFTRAEPTVTWITWFHQDFSSGIVPIIREKCAFEVTIKEII